jgi:uncharacterized protein YprB with RNaseH-like and TPR domain
MEINKPAKILLFDIESTNLAMDFARLLCIGYKWYGEDTVYCPKIKIPAKQGASWDKAEEELLDQFISVYESADIVVTYNGTMFDIPAIQAKMIHYDMGALPSTSHIDLYFTTKSKLRISRKSLQNLGYFAKLEHHKTGVEGHLWLLAQAGNKQALNAIVDHCEVDVILLEEAYEKLRPLVYRHPRVSGYGPCRYCGSTELQKRGRYVTKDKNPKCRVQCQACGGWDTRLPKELGL